MSPISIILTLLFASALVDATGHLRLELTASTNCELRVVTESSDEKIVLTMGEKQVTSFHPEGLRDMIKISLSTSNGKTVFYDFPLKNTGRQQKSLYEESDLVILIQSTYECNKGFFGLTCEFVGTPRAIKRTTTTTAPTTTTNTQKTTEQSTTESTTTAEVPKPSRNPNNTLIIIVLVVIIVSFTALIIVFAILLTSSRRISQQHIIFADKPQTSGKKILAAEKKCKILMEEDEENVYEEIEDVRYTSAPLRTLYVPL